MGRPSHTATMPQRQAPSPPVSPFRPFRPSAIPPSAIRQWQCLPGLRRLLSSAEQGRGRRVIPAAGHRDDAVSMDRKRGSPTICWGGLGSTRPLAFQGAPNFQRPPPPSGVHPAPAPRCHLIGSIAATHALQRAARRGRAGQRIRSRTVIQSPRLVHICGCPRRTHGAAVSYERLLPTPARKTRLVHVRSPRHPSRGRDAHMTPEDVTLPEAHSLAQQEDD